MKEVTASEDEVAWLIMAILYTKHFNPYIPWITHVDCIDSNTRVVKGRGGGGYRSHFTENKTALSQFTKNITLAFHASRKIKENILENHGSRRLWKSRFTRKKKSHFTFHGK